MLQTSLHVISGCLGYRNAPALRCFCATTDGAHTAPPSPPKWWTHTRNFKDSVKYTMFKKNVEVTKELPWWNDSSIAAPDTLEILSKTAAHALAKKLTARAFIQKVTSARKNVGILWKGDYHLGKNFLFDIQRTIAAAKTPAAPNDFVEHRHFQARAAAILARLMIRVNGDYTIQLPRAPDLRVHIAEALQQERQPGEFLLSLKDLLAFVGAHEWRKKGVAIPALNGSIIHPHFSVYSPIRGEYLDMIARTPLPIPHPTTCYDIGTGTGVIAALLAQRGIPNIVATDISRRAIICAKENIARLGLEAVVRCELTDTVFPPGSDSKADLIVCNPPWLPLPAGNALERSIYDDNSRMLQQFLGGLKTHLAQPHGEAWLILSDIAELLRLRAPSQLRLWFDEHRLQVVDVARAKPSHWKARNENDPFHEARAAECTYLYRLRCI